MCSDCVPPEHRGHRLERDAHDVVLRLLRRRAAAGGLRVEAQLPRARILRAVLLAHVARVDPARRAKLGDLFEEVDVRVEEERKARRERIDVHSGGHAGLDVRKAVGERERQLLRRRRTGLANVIAGDRDRVPLRHLARAELDHVDDDAHVRTRRKDPFLLRDVLFEDVGLNRAAELRARNALLLGGGDVLRERDAGRPVDRHRRRDLAHVDAVEEQLHVGERVDRDAALADLAARLRRVGVVPHQRRHVERHREAVLPVLEQEMIALVRLRGRAEAGELAHRPQPVAIAVGDGCRACRDTRRATPGRAPDRDPRRLRGP